MKVFLKIAEMKKVCLFLPLFSTETKILCTVYRGPDIYTVLDECDCEYKFGRDNDGEINHFNCDCEPDEQRHAIYDGAEFCRYVYQKFRRF